MFGEPVTMEMTTPRNNWALRLGLLVEFSMGAACCDATSWLMNRL